MFDILLHPASSHLIKLCMEYTTYGDVVEWLRVHPRDRWNGSMLMGAISGTFYFWFHDELDFDKFRDRFGGAIVR